jgi:nucleotide-binding universal stress UspA family protein
MTVLVGVQGTAGSRAAIRVAAEEARFRNTKLVAVSAYSAEHVAAAPPGRPVGSLRTSTEERSHAESMLQEATLEALGADAGQVELRVVQGVPGRSLVEAARTVGAELLVLATRADGVLSWLLGSQYVLRNAPCPVLLVPEHS